MKHETSMLEKTGSIVLRSKLQLEHFFKRKKERKTLLSCKTHEIRRAKRAH